MSGISFGLWSSACLQLRNALSSDVKVSFDGLLWSVLLVEALMASVEGVCISLSEVSRFGSFEPFSTIRICTKSSLPAIFYGTYRRFRGFLKCNNQKFEVVGAALLPTCHRQTPWVRLNFAFSFWMD